MSIAGIEQYSAPALFAGTFLVSYLAWYVFSKQKEYNGKKLPPSVGSLPLVGSMPFLPERCVMPKFFLEKASTCSDVMSFSGGGKYIVILSSYEAIREALIKQSVETADRPQHYLNGLAFNPKGKGIVDAHYNAHFRKIHQQSLSILKDFGFGQRMMEERIRLEVEDLIKNFRALNGQKVYAKNLVAASVLSVISSIVMDDRLKDSSINKRVADAAIGMTQTSIELFPIEFIHSLRHLPKFKVPLETVTRDMNVLLEISNERINRILEGKDSASNESFISKFIEREGTEFDAEGLRFIVRDLIVAGFETSSTTLLWALLSLANRPEIQDRLQAELDSVVPRDRLPSLDDKSKLPYVEAFILEVMRHDTLVPLSVPRANLEDIIVSGYIIPKNSMLMANLYAAHMNKETWGDPENFRPERFLDQSGTEIINKERVIPFSIGKRSCLGELLARQEIFLFITGLLQQFHIRPPEGVDVIHAKELPGFTISPEPFDVRFLPRE